MKAALPSRHLANSASLAVNLASTWHLGVNHSALRIHTQRHQPLPLSNGGGRAGVQMGCSSPSSRDTVLLAREMVSNIFSNDCSSPTFLSHKFSPNKLPAPNSFSGGEMHLSKVCGSCSSGTHAVSLIIPPLPSCPQICQHKQPACEQQPWANRIKECKRCYLSCMNNSAAG